MNQDKKIQVVMLATNANNSNGFCKRKDNNKLLKYPSTEKDHEEAEYQHLYLISDDEIKEGDWILWNGKVVKAINTSYHSAKKIITSTDKSLGLPEPLKEWLEYFVSEYNKGNIITEVMVEYEKIIETMKDKSIYAPHIKVMNSLKVNSDNTINIKINPIASIPDQLINTDFEGIEEEHNIKPAEEIWDKRCGLSLEEFKIDKLCDKIKSTKSSLECIKIVSDFIKQ